MSKDICIKNGTYRYDTENVIVFFDRELGLEIINKKESQDYYKYLLEVCNILEEIKQLENG